MTMTWQNPYARLMRLHQPVGIWLVFWPCAWALVLFGEIAAIPLFFAGAVITRSAGCTINDMADREFDKHVTRTKMRPLASGELSLTQAFRLLTVLTIGALTVLAGLMTLYPTITFSKLAICTAIAVTFIVAYPFMKRITWWPQAFLGLTFNAGVWFAALAAGELTNPATWWLYAACFFWTLAYDTIYGHQDAEDDAKIGIKSTSRHFGGGSLRWLSGFYGACVLLMAIACWHAPIRFGLCLPALAWMAGHFLWQLRATDLASPPSCLRAFKSNVWMGAGFWLLLWLSTLLA